MALLELWGAGTMKFWKKKAQEPAQAPVAVPAIDLCGVIYPVPCKNRYTKLVHGWKVCDEHLEARGN